MPLNIEIKAIARMGLEKANKLAAALLPAGEAPQLLKQKDTFFEVPDGRLKLREEGDSASLVAYKRVDTAEAKRSDYAIAPVPDVNAMLQTLGKVLRLRGTVQKQRTLYLVTSAKYGLTARIHLDDVHLLGEYIEFEVIIPNDTHEENGKKYADDLIEHFGITRDDLLCGAYLDELKEKGLL